MDEATLELVYGSPLDCKLVDVGKVLVGMAEMGGD